MIAWRFGYSKIGALAHPLGVLFAGAIALNSARCYRAGRVLWAGRVYGTREAREGAS